jgi:hypothetical protein
MQEDLQRDSHAQYRKNLRGRLSVTHQEFLSAKYVPDVRRSRETDLP